MNADRWARIKDLFCIAIQGDEAHAHQVLQAARDQDPALVAEVASLVREHFRLESASSSAAEGLPAIPAILSNSSRFRFAKRIGSGTFGDVHKVLDAERGEFLALKILREQKSAPLLYFKREFRNLANLYHPNLVKLHEMFTLDGQWMFTMELLEGQTYLEFVRQGSPISDANAHLNQRETRIRTTLPQFGEALKALHSRGLLHRDLKPSNVIVTKESRLVVLDFGLVRDFAEDSSASLILAGTPDYMSPEQAAFSPLSEASDWYAVGVMLYQALTGGLPFTGSVTDILRRKQNERPRPPREVDPDISADLSEFCMGLMDLNPAVRLQVAAAASYKASTVPNLHPEMPATVYRLDFIGRRRELQQLNEAFDRTTARLVSVHVSGSSGVGKTLLVREFLNRLRIAHRGVLVFSGRCFSTESVPFKGIDDLVDSLTQYLRRMAREEMEQLLPRNFQLLTRLFPVLGEIRAADRRIAVPPEPLELRLRAFAALRELLGRISERHRVVLTIDDLQWSDPDGCAFLKELVDSPEPPALLLLLAYRSEDIVAVPWLKALRTAEAADTRGTVLLDLSGLGPGEAADLARSITRSRPDIGEMALDALVEESGGDPFLINELAYWLTVHGGNPQLFSVRDAVNARRNELRPAERRLLELVAVAGRPVAIAAFTNAVPSEGLARARDALLIGRLLRSRAVEGREEVEVFHDRIREAILELLTPGELREHHMQLALALEAFGSDAEQLALHFHHAGDRVKAATLGRIAANRAAQALAFDKAARLYRLTLEDGAWNGVERLSLLRSRGDALASGGQGFQASEAYESAAELAGGIERLRLLTLAAGQQLRSGYVPRGLALLTSVLKQVGLASPSNRKLQLVWIGFLRMRIALHGLRFRETAAEEVDPNRLLRIDLCGTAAIGLSMLDPLRSVGFSSRYLLLALKEGEPYRVALALAGEATQVSHSSRLRNQNAASKLLRRADEIVERLQSHHGRAFTMIMRGVVAYLNGEWRTAVKLCEAASDILRSHCHGVQWELNTAATFACVVRFVRGEWGQNRRLLPGLTRDAESRGDLYGQLSLRILGCAYVLDLAAGNPERALADLNRDIELWSHDQQFDLQHCNALIGKIDISLYCRNPEQGIVHLDKEWPLLVQSGLLRVPTTFAFSYCARGRLALAMAESAKDSSREKFLRMVRAAARALLERGPAWSHSLALLLQCGVASFTGDVDILRNSLTRAESALRSADFTPFRMAVLYRQACLEPAPRSTVQWAEAEAWTASEEITDPERVFGGLAPGLWPRLS